MPLTNQTSTGKPVPRQVKWLKRAIKDAGGPSMTYISVHCFSLALALDRLEALEIALKEIEQSQKVISRRLY